MVQTVVETALIQNNSLKTLLLDSLVFPCAATTFVPYVGKPSAANNVKYVTIFCAEETFPIPSASNILDT